MALVGLAFIYCPYIICMHNVIGINNHGGGFATAGHSSPIRYRGSQSVKMNSTSSPIHHEDQGSQEETQENGTVLACLPRREGGGKVITQGEGGGVEIPDVSRQSGSDYYGGFSNQEISYAPAMHGGDDLMHGVNTRRYVQERSVPSARPYPPRPSSKVMIPSIGPSLPGDGQQAPMIINPYIGTTSRHTLGGHLHQDGNVNYGQQMPNTGFQFFRGVQDKMLLGSDANFAQPERGNTVELNQMTPQVRASSNDSSHNITPDETLPALIKATPVTLNSNTMNKTLMGHTPSNSRMKHSFERHERRGNLLIPEDFIPNNRSRIDKKHARKMWKYANHFSKDLPKSDPSEKQLSAFQDTLLGIYDYTLNRCHDHLLKHLQSLARQYGHTSNDDECQGVKGIETIHFAVLRSTSAFTQEYLETVIEFIKLPQKELKGKAWLDDTINDIINRYDIQFPFNGSKNFVDQVGQKNFNNCHNLRLRRGMVAATGCAWYDRKPSDKKLKTLFKDAETKSEEKIVWIGSIGPIKGHLVKRVGKKEQAFSPRKLDQAIRDAKTEKELFAGVRKIWKEAVRRLNTL